MTNRVKFLPFIFLCLLSLFAGKSYAVEWVSISGQVLFGSTPLCSMVLANGQHTFSCDGSAHYNMTVPLDTQGLITLQVYTAGFAPYRQVLTPGQATNYTVNMVRDEAGRNFDATYKIGPSTLSGGWTNVSGTIDFNGTPLCAMVLINGQNVFSCGQNLGKYSLDAPLDSSGNVTVQVFAFGFQPFRIKLSDPAILNGRYDGVMKSPMVLFYPADSTYTTFDISGTNVEITQDHFFGETCIFTGLFTDVSVPMSASGTYRCSDFTSGTWSSTKIAKTTRDAFIAELDINTGSGTYVAKYNGFLDEASVRESYSSDLSYYFDSGSYLDIGGAYTGNLKTADQCAGYTFEISSSDTTISLVGNTLEITQDSFFEGICVFSGTVTNTGVLPLSASGTYMCSNFDEGSWSSSKIALTGVDSFFAELEVDVPSRGCSYAVKYSGFK